MKYKLRRRLLFSAITGLVLAVGALVSPVAVERLYAAPRGCSCSADCLFGSCSCIGERFCICTCVFFVDSCNCDNFPT